MLNKEKLAAKSTKMLIEVGGKQQTVTGSGRSGRDPSRFKL